MDLQRRLSPGKELRLPSRLIDPPDGLVPYQPWAEARRKQQEGSYDHPTRPEHIDTQHRFLLGGIPRFYTNVPPFRIIQSPGTVVFTTSVLPSPASPVTHPELHVGRDVGPPVERDHPVRVVLVPDEHDAAWRLKNAKRG